MTKLTRQQWIELDTQFAVTPGLDDSLVSGQHYVLMAVLNSFGLYPHSRQEAMQIAEDLLCQAWEQE